MRQSTAYWVSILTVLATGCQTADRDDRTAGTESVRLAGKTQEQKCDSECDKVCPDTTDCQRTCYLREERENEIHCHATTCGASSGLPCEPGTGGSGGSGGEGGGGGGGGGACGPQLCRANLNLGKLVGQKVDWALEGHRKFRAVYDFYAYPQSHNFPECDFECCDFYSAIRVRHCEGHLASGNWGAGAGEPHVCHPTEGQDQSICKD
jgi:hypothetical protein